MRFPLQAQRWRARHGTHDADAERMPKENNNHTYADCETSTLFREFAAEFMELAQITPTPEKRSLYMKMASLWHRTAQRWEKKV